jgi:acetolactate synthase-1/2/3 large subunit
MPLVTDVGQHQMWAAQYLNFTRPRTFVSSGGLGTMGFGMGAAIGASVATGKHVILVTGDGSFAMDMAEFVTAADHDIPLTVVLLNNGVLGMVRQWQSLFYGQRHSNTTLARKVDYPAVVRAMGGEGLRVSTLEELEDALASAVASDVPTLIECPVDKDEFVTPMLPPGGTMDDLVLNMDDVRRRLQG